MYLNRAQKYVLELLGKYDVLKKSQLEIMVRYKVSEYLKDLNGYLKQLRQEQQIDVIPCGKNDAYICLPGADPDDDLIAAFDVITAIRERAENHRKGNGRVQIKFDYIADENRIHDAFVLVVHPGMEQEISAHADKHLQQDFHTVFFLCAKKAQMKKINSICNHIFAVKIITSLFIFYLYSRIFSSRFFNCGLCCCCF